MSIRIYHTCYREQADKPFEHEARLKTLLARQMQLNAALDLDKNEKQIAPSAEDDIGLAGEPLPKSVPALKPQRAFTSVVSP